MLTRDVQGFGRHVPGHYGSRGALGRHVPGHYGSRGAFGRHVPGHYDGFGAVLQTPMGPINLPIEGLAQQAFDFVWPSFRKRLRAELIPTIIGTGVLMGIMIVGANYYMLREMK